MKRTLILLGICAFTFTFTACDNSNGKTDDPVVTGVSVSPATFSLFTDEALPTLEAILEPKDIESDVAWTSSNPEIIAVDAETGAISFAIKDIADESKNVTITATAGEKSGSCVITVKGQIGRYEIIDCTDEIGMLFLDRNIGATAVYDRTLSEAGANDASFGNFYQWGKNTPVAKAGETAVNSNFADNWNAEGEGFSDWAVAANTPCPIGWSIPNKAQMKVIENATSWSWDFVDFGMMTEEEMNVIRDFCRSLKFTPSGAFDAATGAKKAGLVTAFYFWSSELNTTDAPDASNIKYIYSYCDNNFAVTNSKDFVNMAMPVRCIKVVAAE